MRAAIWSNVERAIGRIQAVSAQFRALHRVLLKKRSQAVHLTFAELVEVCQWQWPRANTSSMAQRGRRSFTTLLFSSPQPSSGGISHKFWMFVTDELAKLLSECSKDTSIVGRALEAEYPRLLQIFHECWR